MKLDTTSRSATPTSIIKSILQPTPLILYRFLRPFSFSIPGKTSSWIKEWVDVVFLVTSRMFNTSHLQAVAESSK
jgi:hypothetical protein